MDKKTIYAMKNAFDEIVKIIQEEAVEFWYARDLMALLGYDRWENFHKAIERAIAVSYTHLTLPTTERV